MNKKGETYGMVLGVILIVILCVGFIGLLMWGGPKYRIYRLDLSGQADLAEAEWTKKIMVEEAKAERDAATLLAAAEIERAKGVAEANEIIGESLKQNEAYLRYLWINGLHDGNGETVYIATEAGLPIMEAGRFK